MELKNKQIIIETTNICDAHCVICPREQFKSKLRSMDMGLFKKIIDDGAQYEIESIDTCGFGEAFLDKHLFERFAYVREKMPDAKTFVSTTGYHMTSDTWGKVIDYIDILKLSIYGVTKDTYEAFHRGKVRYDKVMANINGFLGYRDGTGYGPEVVGLFVATEQNQHEQDEWLELWEPRLDEVMIWKPHNWVDARGYRAIDRSRQISCGRPFNAPLYVHADGIVSPCCWDINSRIPLGDMNKQTIAEVYSGEAYRKLRDAHKRRDFEGYICQDCDQTNHDDSVLIYSNNKARKVGQLTSNESMVYEEESTSVRAADIGASELAGTGSRSL